MAVGVLPDRQADRKDDRGNAPGRGERRDP
jgi:hypothetical protein